MVLSPCSLRFALGGWKLPISEPAPSPRGEPMRHRGMLDRGHAGSLLFKAALKSVNSTSPLNPSGLTSSIFLSAFVFLASEEGGAHLQGSIPPLGWFGVFFLADSK